MYSCPACGAQAAERADTCRCGADLSLLRGLEAVPDAYFNRALKALADGQPGRALEWLAACCATRPNDAAAARALAKVWAQLGHPAEAQAALDRARVIEPDAPEAAAIQQVLDALSAPKTRKQAPPVRGKPKALRTVKKRKTPKRRQASKSKKRRQ